MSLHAIAHGGCKDTVRESALKVDSGEEKKNPSPHRGIEPTSAACRPDALPTELHPQPFKRRRWLQAHEVRWTTNQTLACDLCCGPVSFPSAPCAAERTLKSTNGWWLSGGGFCRWLSGGGFCWWLPGGGFCWWLSGGGFWRWLSGVAFAGGFWRWLFSSLARIWGECSTIHLGECSTIHLGECSTIHLGECSTIHLEECSTIHLGEYLTIHSPPALFLFKVEISSRTLTLLLMPESIHSGSANWDDCGWMFPENHLPNKLITFPTSSRVGLWNETGHPAHCHKRLMQVPVFSAREI